MRRIALRGIALCCLVGLTATFFGCESAPMRTWRGARHYAAGSDALVRNQGERAIAELEQAALLVPHASEIQNHLGLAYWSEGRTIRARGAFEKAVELDCENLAAKTNLQRLDRSIREASDEASPGAEDAEQGIGRTAEIGVGSVPDEPGRGG